MIIKRQAGMSLIEMLVAAVLLAGGIVGSLALQTSANRTTFDAMQRSNAAALAHDILARMRANTQGEAPPTVSSVLKQYTRGDVFKKYGKVDEIVVPDDMCDTTSGEACNTEKVAKYDLYMWEQKLVGKAVSGGTGGVTATDNITSIGLTKPRGCIKVVDNFVEIAITWRGRTETIDATDPNNYPSGTFANGDLREICHDGKSLQNRQVYVNAFVF